MADLTLKQIFGKAAFLQLPDGAPSGVAQELIIRLENFADSDNGNNDGEIENGLGLNAPENITTANADEYARKILYAQLMLIMQNQAESIFTDPEQKLFVAEQAPRLGTGSRSGQIQRTFSVSFFTTANVTSVPDIDDI